MQPDVILPLVAVAVIGGTTTLALTPLVRRLASKLHLVDYPDSVRKLHDHPVPLGGGVIVLVGTATATLLALVAPHEWQGLLWKGGHHLAGLFLAALLVNLLGLADDCLHLGARRKLAGQILVALVIVVAGLEIRRVQLLDWQVELGLLSIPFTLFWILGATNALNLLDGSDGVATTVGIVLCLALAAMALMLPNRQIEAIVALALAGSLAGFLCYNFPPASIYLGDSGSMLIGLVIGVLALRSGLKGPATIALAAPTAICAIPILDTAMAIIRRTLTGRSVYATDRGHLHHCLLRHGLSRRATVLSIGALCTWTAVAALASVYRRNELLALVGILAVVGTLIVTRYFGHEESRMLTTRLASAVGPLFVLATSAIRMHEKDGKDVKDERDEEIENEALHGSYAARCEGICDGLD
jgi:UDP-GlcNAc:undecaprenyl-phosphate GlcNAc-1-phosphate transferase